MLMFLFACTIETGSGVSATETRELETFSAINNTTQVAVTWAAAEEQSAALTCDDNLLGVFRTTVDDGVLTLDTPNGVLAQPQVDCVLALEGDCLWGIDVSGSGDVSAGPSGCLLSSLESSGSGRITVSGAQSDALSVSLSGSGGAEVDGSVGEIELRVSGSGGLAGRDLLAADAAVRMSSSADVHLSVSASLEADLSGSGSLHVYGDPQSRSVEATGSGEVRYR